MVRVKGIVSHETNNSNHFDQGKDKFSFAVSLDAEQVYAHNQQPKDRDPNSRIDGRIPVSDCDCCSDDFKRQDNQPLHRVTLRFAIPVSNTRPIE